MDSAHSAHASTTTRTNQPAWRYRNSFRHALFVNQPAVMKLLPMIEDVLAPFSARPHWGKLFTVSPKLLESRYEKLQDFRQLLSQHDPHGKFRNAFLDLNIFGIS